MNAYTNVCAFVCCYNNNMLGIKNLEYIIKFEIDIIFNLKFIIYTFYQVV